MSIKIQVTRNPRTRTTEYHLQVHALVRVPDEVIAVAEREVESAVAARLRKEVIVLANEPGVRFQRDVF